MKNIILFILLLFISSVAMAETFPVKPCLISVSNTQVVNANFVESIGFIRNDPSTKQIFIKMINDKYDVDVKVNNEKPLEEFQKIVNEMKSKCS